MRNLLLQGLLRSPLTEPRPADDDAELVGLLNQLKHGVDTFFGRSLAIRQVDAGSCNACELEIHALNNPFYDLERFGLKFVASPRHADAIMVTGPVTENMREALKRTYDATPSPKWVIAVGGCALDGGIYSGGYAIAGGASEVIPVDLHIPGCPPAPPVLIKGLLALLAKGRRP
jgi:Ni,Fe-hydrogenase III small subunit